MKAVVCTEPFRLDAIDYPEPAIGGDLALISVSHIGICGTDHHILRGEHPFFEYPRIMGHELSGSIAQAAPESTFALGERVIVNPYIPCGTCIACRKEKTNCCATLNVLGVHSDGGMCELVAVPEKNLIPAGDLQPRHAAMIEFLAIGVHATTRSALQSGDRVLVVGAGPIGIAIALFAQLAGGAVTTVDRSERRLEFLRDKLGFPETIAANADLGNALDRVSQGEGFDVVFDATGSAESMQANFEFVGHGGTYVLVSIVKDDISFSDPILHGRELSVLGSRNATNRDFEVAVKNVAAGRIPLDTLNTHSGRLDSLATDLLHWIDIGDEVVKAVVATK